jgi:putative ABC transport system permease protein
MMEFFWQHLRRGIRLFRHNPGFASIAILTVALGIGANTAIFSVVNAVLLRPLPFPESSRLVLLYEGFPKLGFPKAGFSAPDLIMYQRAQKSFLGMAAYQNKDFELSGAREPERVVGARISASLFSVLGVPPVLGRSFQEEEDQPGHSVAILSYGLWQSKYGGSRDVIRQTVTLDRVAYTVVGVMPRDFQFPLRGAPMNSRPAELWVPMAFTREEVQGWGNMYNSSVIARLRLGVTLAQARSEADVLAQRVQQAYPASLMAAFGNPTLSAQVAGLQSELIGEVRPMLLLLQGAVGLVLLIACVNVGLLLLSRASSRSAEIAIRTALGAGRGRLLAQLLSETLVLAIPGGVLGFLLAAWSRVLLLRQLPASIALPREVPVDGAVLGFTLVTTLLTALFFGVAPALQATRSDIRGALQEGGRSGTASRAHHRIQGTFVITEFALALILLVSAGLLLRSFAKLLEASPGFRPEGVLAMSVRLPAQAYPRAGDVHNYYQNCIARLSQLPGVISVAASSDLPLNGTDLGALRVENRLDVSVGNTAGVRVTWMLGDYLRTMGIPLIHGRAIGPEDGSGGLPVALISESLAHRIWPDEDPVGKRIQVEGEAKLTIVGVVGDVPDAALSVTPAPHVYKSYLQQSNDYIEGPTGGLLRSLNLAFRTQGNPALFGAAAVDELHKMDPALAVVDVRTMETEVKGSISPQRFNAMMVGVYAGLALLLALVGIYGVVAFMVAQQTHEIGVRMALGAQRRDMLSFVLLRGARLALLGAAVGLPAAWAITRLLASLLYGVSPRDPAAFFGATLLLGLAALLACYVPALRATRVDPMVALRYQ